MTSKRMSRRGNINMIHHLHMVKDMNIHRHRCLMSRAPRRKVLLAHRGNANGAVDVGDVDHIDVHIGVLHMNARAFAYV